MARGRPRKTRGGLLKSAEMIGWALGGLEREIAQTREKLTALTAHASRLRRQLGGQAAPRTSPSASDGTPVGSKASRRRPRRKMSAEARKRISEMMRKRWAERKRRGLKTL
jgi:hypothetical protein